MLDVGNLDPDDRERQSTSVGTRFLIYPQVPLVLDYEKPETVWISTRRGTILPGPSDHRILVRDPILDKQPYDPPYLPPYTGDTYPPAEAGLDGHFDTLPVQSRQFVAAHAFACASRVLDVWENYLGHPIVWHFSETYERLEIIPQVEWDNAQSGYGYLELGVDRASDGRVIPFALNFDVIAHEIGHSIQFALFGFPAGDMAFGDFRSIHEANADLISLISFMHFDSGLDRLLRHCNGNLLVLNELNRIAELSGDQQFRIASNSRKLSDVSADVHDRSRPFTGALFDTIVDGYHVRLVREGLADEGLLEIDIKDADARRMQRISDETKRNFRNRPFMFKSALTQSRDDVALALSRSWSLLDVNDLTFASYSEILIEQGFRINRVLGEKLAENLAWRELI